MLILHSILKPLKLIVLAVTFILSSTGISHAASDFYWKNSYGRGVGTALINSSYTRGGDNMITSCRQAEYPRHVGARCYRQEVCSDRNGGGKSWGYDFDNVSTCWRKKETTSVPKSYPAPSAAEYYGCDYGKQQIGARCYSGCDTNYQAGTAGFNQATCYHERNGLCPTDKENQSSLCYVPCRSGYEGNGPVCWAKSPSNYIACGAGFAANSATCALTTVDQTLSAGALANIVTGNVLGAKAAMAAKTLKRLAKMPVDAPVVIVRAGPELFQLGARYGDEFMYLAQMASKGPLSASDIARMNTLVNNYILKGIRNNERMSAAFVYMATTIAPNIASKWNDPASSNLPIDLDTQLEWVRAITGIVALGMDLYNPAPGPHTAVVVGLDLISSYLYPVYGQ